MKTRNITLDVIAIIILGILTIIVVGLQVFTLGVESTKLESGLFNVIQLILSLGFSWLLTRVVTRSEFQESLERFAISAYRRIRDIDTSLSRMKSEIIRMRSSYPQSEIHELDVINIIASNMTDTVKSSIADWTEVIGDKLQAEQRIIKLEEQYSMTTLSAMKSQDDEEKQEAQKDLEQLREQIESLRSEIPQLLGYDIKPLSAYESPEFVEVALRSSLESQRELTLYAEADRRLSFDELQAIEVGKTLYLHPGRAMHSFNFVVLDGRFEDETYKFLGEILNSFSGLGIDHIEFNMALLNVMTPYVRRTEDDCADIDHIPVEFVGLSPSSRNQFILRFKLPQ